MNMDLKFGIRGRYRIEAVAADGSRRLLADWFKNLITNVGLDQIAAASTWMSNCYVGAGNTAPAFTDTSLVSQVASTSTILTTTQTAAGSSPYFGTTTNVYQFAIGVATGNLSEVGVGASGTALFSRALILDGGGSPTTITVLSSEALNVTYAFEVFVPLSDVTGSITINGTSYGYTVRAANSTATGSWACASTGEQAGINNATAYNGSIGAITGAPSGSNVSGQTRSILTYTSGNYFLDTQLSYSLSQGNLSGGISAMLITFGQRGASFGAFQIGFSPALPKDSSHTMTLTFRQLWVRH